MNERIAQTEHLAGWLEQMAYHPVLTREADLFHAAATTVRNLAATLEGALHRNAQLERVIQLADDTLKRHHHRLQNVMGGSTVPATDAVAP